MHIVLQYIFATRNALISGSPATVAQMIVCATLPGFIEND
jgi:hypothetical protein